MLGSSEWRKLLKQYASANKMKKAVHSIERMNGLKGLGHAFNSHIERVIYGRPVRQALGFRAATYVYTGFAFYMNALHARCDPRGGGAMAIFGLLFLGAKAWIGGWTAIARAVLFVRALSLR